MWRLRSCCSTGQCADQHHHHDDDKHDDDGGKHDDDGGKHDDDDHDNGDYDDDDVYDMCEAVIKMVSKLFQRWFSILTILNYYWLIDTDDV